MTPKEKAKQLVDYYQSILSNFKQSHSHRQNNYAKLLANKLYDEMFFELQYMAATVYVQDRIEMWGLIKTEIKKL